MLEASHVNAPSECPGKHEDVFEFSQKCTSYSVNTICVSATPVYAHCVTDYNAAKE